jgi:protein TonB
MEDHKNMYGIYIRSSMLVSLIIFSLAFLFIPTIEVKPYELNKEIVTMVEEISAQIEKFEEPPPVEHPKVAVAAENNVADEAVETIAETVFKEDILRTTPTGPDIEVIPYYKVEVKPQPIHIPKPAYPALPLQAGIEGQTVIKALVDVDGSITEVQILKSSGNQMLDQAALAAAKGAKFTPARERDKNVRVWVSIPMRFRLTSS